jgi:cbb3-type cytochrome oxidase maturation protein
MDILFLLIPMSVLLALGLIGLLAWAVFRGQFEDLDAEALRIFDETSKSDGKSHEKDGNA